MSTNSKNHSSPKAELTLRRLRQNAWTRDLSRSVWLHPRQFMQPLFVVEGVQNPEPVPGLTGTHRETPSTLLKQIESDLKVGVSKFLLFGVPGKKASHQFSSDFTARQIAAIKKQFGRDVFLAVDVCLCSSTDHGQCGVLTPEGDHVDNSVTVEALAQQATVFAQAGADCVAPSDMMDGRVGAIRESLARAGLERTVLMSYSAKFHSRFYGPFRVAADSAPKGDVKIKDRSTYQIDPGNYQDALRSSLRDVEEGADLLMVKPALPYLDVLYRLSQEIQLPWAAYEVSGEYASIELMAREGLMNREQAHLEAWTALVRAGASLIISYGSREAQAWIQKSYES